MSFFYRWVNLLAYTFPDETAHHCTHGSTNCGANGTCHRSGHRAGCSTSKSCAYSRSHWVGASRA